MSKTPPIRRTTPVFVSASIALALTAASTMSTAARAETQVRLSLPMLHYVSDSQTLTPDEGEETKNDSGGVATALLEEAEISVFWAKFVVALNPFADAKVLSLGFMVMPKLEVGADFGYNSTSTKEPETESSRMLLGAYGVGSQKLGKFAVEARGGVRYASSSSTTTTKSGDPEVETETKTESSGFGFEAEGLVVVPLAKNVSYAGGVGIGYDSSADAESKLKTSSFRILLTLASLRVSI